jgi:hypothetical protein
VRDRFHPDRLTLFQVTPRVRSVSDVAELAEARYDGGRCLRSRLHPFSFDMSDSGSDSSGEESDDGKQLPTPAEATYARSRANSFRR